jgi:Fe-S-cluster-containing hydrogenase component 2
MRWTAEAEAAIKKVPFFVRKKVRSRVEKEAAGDEKTVVDIEAVKTTQKRYLSGMAAEVKGYQLDTCFGPSGCPNRSAISDDLLKRLERVLQEADLPSFLKKQVGGNLKFHHEFRVTVADCPNACSQPQIKDIGIIGAVMPAITDQACSGCGACADVCPDDAMPSMIRLPSTVSDAWPAANASLRVPTIRWMKGPEATGCCWAASWDAIRVWPGNCPAFLTSRMCFVSLMPAWCSTKRKVAAGNALQQF